MRAVDGVSGSPGSEFERLTAPLSKPANQRPTTGSDRQKFVESGLSYLSLNLTSMKLL